MGNGVVQQRCHGELELAGVNGRRWRLCTRAGGSTPFIGKGEREGKQREIDSPREANPAARREIHGGWLVLQKAASEVARGGRRGTREGGQRRRFGWWRGSCLTRGGGEAAFHGGAATSGR